MWRRTSSGTHATRRLGRTPRVESMPRRLGRVAHGSLGLAADVPSPEHAYREEGTNSTYLTVPPRGRRPQYGGSHLTPAGNHGGAD